MGWKTVRRAIARWAFTISCMDDEPVQEPYNHRRGYVDPNSQAMELLIGRMRWTSGNGYVEGGMVFPNNFSHITVAGGKEKVFVFLVASDKPLIIEDDAALFPSDALVTKLRLLGA